ncbi:MAG: hypothetical protein K2X06_02485 [Burkholderiales bacterium]|nr:hypothetical protein [Burkholderiales bacterium]
MKIYFKNKYLTVFSAAILLLSMIMLTAPAAAQVGVRAAAQGNTGPGTNVAFQAAGTAVSGTGNVTVVWPAHAINDIALLFVESAGAQAAALGTPAGFVQVPGSPQTTGAGTRLTVFWARATSAAMASPVVTDPGDHAYARIITYRGAITTGNPWDVTAGGAKATASTSVSLTGVTTTVPNTLIVQAATRELDSTAAAFSGQTNGNLTGIAERADAGGTAGNGGGFAVWDGVMANPGATGNTTATVTNSVNAFLTIALKPNALLTINVPAGTVDDDVMIASITLRQCSAVSGAACTTTISPPAGWTVVDSIDQTTGGAFGQRLVVYRRVAASEPASYTWSFGGTPVLAGAAGGIVSFSGVDTTNPIVASLGQATASSTSHVANQIDTGVVANTMLVTTHSANSATVWNAIAGMTEQVDASSVTVPNDVGVAMVMNTELRAAAGLTGSRTATFTSPPAADTGVSHMLALRPGINHFSITHAGSGVACDVHTITLTAHNASHAPVNANSLAVSLSTTNGRGTWTGIVSGGGTLTGVGAGNGLATYTFAAGSSTAQLSFRYANLAATSETFGFNAVSGVISETSGAANAADDPSFTMAQAGFRFRNITDGSDTIPTQISGKPSNTGFNAKTIRLQAIRTDTATLACAAGFPAAATRNIEMGAECNSPGTCAGSLVSITNNAITTAIPTSADNSAAGASAYYATGGGVPLLFNANSEADIVITYPDAGQISLHARYDLDTGVAGYEMLGSSNLFVVRPFGLAFRGANSGAVVQHGTTNTATLLAAAGDNFTMTLAGYQWASGEDADNDGVPDAGVNITDNGAVANFAATATVASSTNLAGVAGTVSRGVPGVCASAATIALSGGAATAADWCYSEVGNVFLTATVSDYITAGINITGNSGLDGTGAAGGYVGRFRPKRFAVSGAARTNRTVAACSPVSTFTYMDEGLTLAFTLTAQNTLGATTQNYTGTYAKLDPTVGSNNAKQAFGIGARNVSPFAALTTRVSGAYVTSAPAWSSGVLNVTGGNAALVTVTRPTPDDPPDGPYAQVQFGIAPDDGEGVLMAAYDLDVDNSAGNDHTLTGATTEIRYGRLRLGGVSGSQLLAVRVPVEAQYWNGSFWITNADDSCTTLAAGNVGLGNYLGNLNAGETTASITASPLQAGRSAIRLSAPGAANNGSVDVALNLGASPATAANACPAFAPTATAGNKTYLRGKWCGTTATRDPAARARFGIMRGGDEAIYTRENTN